jgi:hypothetical protein
VSEKLVMRIGIAILTGARDEKPLDFEGSHFFETNPNGSTMLNHLVLPSDYLTWLWKITTLDR